MKKSSLFTTIGVIGAAIGGIAVSSYLKDDDKEREKGNSSFENAGIPDQLPEEDEAQIENSKMVSEGSQFGVHYYNAHKEN